MTIKKLLLFDIDGTLLISKGASRKAKAFAMQSVFGTDAGIEKHPFGGKTDWQILREVLEPTGITALEIGQKMPRYQAEFARQLDRIIGDFPVEALAGAHTLIDTLHARDEIMLGLVTGNTSATAPIKLRAAGFDPAVFAVGAYGSESDDRNHLPRLALDRAIGVALHEIAPADVIVIGDTVADVRCARALGAVAVTVFTGFEARDALIAAEPDHALDDLTTFIDTVSLD